MLKIVFAVLLLILDPGQLTHNPSRKRESEERLSAKAG